MLQRQEIRDKIRRDTGTYVIDEPQQGTRSLHATFKSDRVFAAGHSAISCYIILYNQMGSPRPSSGCVKSVVSRPCGRPSATYRPSWPNERTSSRLEGHASSPPASSRRAIVASPALVGHLPPVVRLGSSREVDGWLAPQVDLG